jgi:energy-coupling factor transporter ATP-binding protein EcfA2
MVGFKKASKKALKLRLALAGPAGSGKTYTALMLAEELAKASGGRIAVIDTERQSAELYADRFDFDTLTLDGNYAPQHYLDALKEAREGAYPVVVIDSFSHAWSGEGGILDQKDAMGGKFDAWRKLTPQHNQLVDAILTYPGHIIVTMRSKQEYVVDEYEDGGRKRTKVTKVGMAPVQREGVEYEFTLTADMNMENVLTISKSRCAALPPGQTVRKPDGKFASTLLQWLESASDPVTPEQKEEGNKLLAQLGVAEDDTPARRRLMIECNGGTLPRTGTETTRVLERLRLKVTQKEHDEREPGGPLPPTDYQRTELRRLAGLLGAQGDAEVDALLLARLSLNQLPHTRATAAVAIHALSAMVRAENKEAAPVADVGGAA